MMGTLRRLRRKIREGNFKLTGHAKNESLADDLETADAKAVILTGKIVERLLDDPRGPRYVFRGRARDGREAEVVCRTLGDGTLLIITIYALEQDGEENDNL